MTPSLHDRSLLFGLVALHHRLIARPALEAALAAWRTDSSRVLSQILLEQQALTTEEIEAVEALLRARVSRHGGVAAALNALGMETGTAVPGDGTLDTHAPAADVPRGNETAAPTEAGLRYRVLRPHARGGLGEVFVALDGELNREVALKEIQARHADNADSRARFLLEAEVTGRLEHPGIVPVYGLGCHADGRPYYAMRFIKGHSLQDAAERFHADEGLKADPGKRALELRGLLGRFVAVCNAIAYAHSKGILHRDLKPDNVMLGNYGETLVVDWGLAKSLSDKEPETTGGSVTLRLSTAGESGRTQAGSVLGTPQYMSPEQAAGRLEELSPASDVYGLGATLYHLLTGQAPFVAGNVFAVLERVCRGEFPAPRQVEPSLPAALEAICLKAMACKPEERYASSKDLADDVEHWLGDEPVAAYAEPLRLRLARWRRRHPGLVTGTAALVFTVLTALGVGALLLSAEQGRTLKAEQAKVKAEQGKVKEQEGRALAQVNALLDATPQAVPNILAGLRDFREQVRPRLRAAREKPEPARATLAARRLWQQHRTRAALALLPEDREQLTFLKKRLLAEEVDPEEMLLIRDRLLPHKDALTGELWAEVNRRGVQDAGRFRALVALAAFDPKNERWAKVGREAVGPLLASEPLHVAIWGRGLSDVRDSLMAPLGVAFRDRSRPAEARLAAGVLRDYAAERPAVLADLLADADAQQFPLLLEALRVHGEQAITLLQGLASGGRLASGVSDDHGNHAPTPPPQAVVEKLEKAHGLVTESFALCQTLPLGEFAAVAEALRPSGYRPLRLRPYATADAVLVAAVWQRDGRVWHMAPGLTAAQLKKEDARQRQRGCVAADVAGWRSGQEVVFGALWVKPRKDEDARLYAGVSGDNYVAAQKEWKSKGYVPAALQAVVAPDGKALYSGVWRKAADAPKNWNLTKDLKESVYLENLGDLSRQPVDVSLYLLREGRKSRAERVAEAEKAVVDKPGDAGALYRRGLAYLNADQGEQALADLDATVKKSPRFADGYRYRAIVRARLGRAEGARADLAEFLKLGTGVSAKLHAEVVVAAYLGEEKEALRRLEEATQARPKDAGSLYDAGCIYALAARAAVHRQRLQGGAAVTATLAVPFAALGLPQRLEQIAATAQRRRDHSTQALALLRQAVAAGYDNYAHMDADADLRDEAAFKALLAQGHLDCHYGLVRHVSATREGTELHGLPLAVLLRRGRELAARGYRPVGLSVVEEDGKRVTASVWQRPVVSEVARDRLGQRRANTAIALLKLKRPESAWPVFQHSAHPDAQTYVLHRAGPLGADVRPLLKRLEVEKDTSARQALILALGEYTAEQLPADIRQEWTGRLLGWYRDDPDPGIHGAVDWLLRHGKDGPQPRKLDWGQAQQLQKIDAALASRGRQPPEGRRWYVTGQGQTMVLLGPGEFVMGSPLSEAGRYDNELPHRRRVGRRFAIASKKVTVSQFKRFFFAKDHPKVSHSYTERYSPDADGPIITVTWYDAAQYCNWLSQQEGIPEEQWCYPPIAEIEKCKADGKPLKMPANYLSRTGYRLPSEVEWEFACRAGAEGSRFYGSSVEMLGHYGWYLHNAQDRTWPVGQKKPNGFGLFDMHGNTWDWCQEGYAAYKIGTRGKAAVDEEDKRDITDKLSRALRGGSFSDRPSVVRCAFRYGYRPSTRGISVGLRLARTYD